MRKTLAILTLIAALPVGFALADDDDCFVPMANWQPREAVAALAAENGWTVRRIKIDDGCYEIKGRDGTGREIEVKLDPATLQVVEFEYEDDDHDHKRRKHSDHRDGVTGVPPAGPIAPPANGLFGGTEPPRVLVK